MHRTIEGIVHTDGRIEPLEAVAPPGPRRVLITILDEAPALANAPGSLRHEQLRAALRVGGLLDEAEDISDALMPLSRDERLALAQSVPGDLRVSTAILEEREERY